MKRVNLRCITVLLVTAVLISAGQIWAERPLSLSGQMPRLVREVIVDGDLTEWQSVPSVPIRSSSDISRCDARHTWNGPADASADVYCGWTPKGLYLAALVADDDVRLSEKKEEAWTRDCAQFFVDGRSPDLIGQPGPEGTVLQFIVRPPTVTTPAELIVGEMPGVSCAGKKTEVGYSIELFVPWSILPKVSGRSGSVIGGGFALNDSDSRDGTISGPLQMTCKGRKGLYNVPSNLIRWSLVDKLNAGAPLGPFVAVEAGPGSSAAAGLSVTEQVGPELAAKARFIRLSGACDDGRKTQPVKIKLLPCQAPWSGSRMGVAQLPLDTSEMGDYTVAAVLVDARGQSLGTAGGDFLTDGLKPCSFSNTTAAKISQCEYMLYLPRGYGKDKKADWPLVLFLHGAGQKGNDIQRLRDSGPPKMAAEGKKFPFIMVSPQCPVSDSWTYKVETLSALLDDVEARYKVDRSRIYVTGFSMGGFGTWALAIKEPDRFAAIAPICGGGDRSNAGKLKDLPMWVFHGEKDTVVPPQCSQEMVDAVKAAGGNPRFTLYPDLDHLCWDRAYYNPEFWDWLLAQKKK